MTKMVHSITLTVSVSVQLRVLGQDYVWVPRHIDLTFFVYNTRGHSNTQQQLNILSCR